MSVPFEQIGYAVDVRANLVHKRHAEHAIGLTRTTQKGLAAYLVDPRACSECWPDTTPQEPGYWCEQCGRRHIQGSAIFERHSVPAGAKRVELSDEESRSAWYVLPETEGS